MKTPMQELIEELEQSINGSEFEPNRTSERVAVTQCINSAKKLLEKEKQVIIDAYKSGVDIPVEKMDSIAAEQYYNETFNQ